MIARHVINEINNDDFEVTDDDWMSLNLMLLDKIASRIVPSKSFINSTQVKVKSGQIRSLFMKFHENSKTLSRSRAWMIYHGIKSKESNSFLIQGGFQIETV